MVYKIGTLSKLDILPSMDAKVLERLTETLEILDDNYGSDRNIDSKGGYVLYAELGTKDTEVLSWFDYKEYIPEYVDYIESVPGYCCTLYLVSDDYAVVIFTAYNDTPKEIANEIQG